MARRGARFIEPGRLAARRAQAVKPGVQTLSTFEHELQCSIVAHHAKAVAPEDAVLFAVPNGGARSQAEGGRLKAEGVLAGTADLVLVIGQDPRAAALVRALLALEGMPEAARPLLEQLLALVPGRVVFSEVKLRATPFHEASYQKPGQKAFQARVEALGHPYRIWRSLEDYEATMREFGVRLRTQLYVPAPAPLRGPLIRA